MDQKNQLQKTLEGLTLIVVGLFVLILHVFRLVPETETFLFLKISIFDLLQSTLKIAVMILIAKHYKGIVALFSNFYTENLIVHPETKTDLNFLVSFFDFFVVVFFYGLSVPEIKLLIEESGNPKPFLVTAMDLFFICVGIFQVQKIWRSAQSYIAEIASKKTPSTPNVDEGTTEGPDPSIISEEPPGSSGA